MALFCAQYLSSAPFNLKQDKFSIKEHCLAGYYGFLDYAVANWWKHARRPGINLDQDIPSEVRKLLSTLSSSSEGENEVAGIDDVTAVWAQTQNLQDDGKGWEAAFPTEERVKPIRSCLESLFNGPGQQDSKNLEEIRELYGRVDYKCKKPWCHFFLLGFSILQARQDHMAQHERPFRCGSDGCHGYQIGFAKESELIKHNNRVHCQISAINFPLPVSNSHIFMAAKKGKLNDLKALIDAGVDVNSRSEDNKTPLFLAAKAGHYQVCQLLLEQGAEVDAPCTMSKRTALHAVVGNKDSDIARLFIDHGADIIHAGPSSVVRPVDLFKVAINKRSSEIVALFLEQLRKRDPHFSINEKILTTVIGFGDQATLKVLLQSKCITVEEHHLYQAIDNRQDKILEMLIENDSEVPLDEGLIFIAVDSGLAEVKLLLSTGRFQITDERPILKALRDKRPLIAEAILRYQNLRLIDGQLKECGKLARQMGFEDVAAVIDKIKGLQRKLLMFGQYPCQAQL